MTVREIIFNALLVIIICQLVGLCYCAEEIKALRKKVLDRRSEKE